MSVCHLSSDLKDEWLAWEGYEGGDKELEKSYTLGTERSFIWLALKWNPTLYLDLLKLSMCGDSHLGFNFFIQMIL